jgi:large subunit ribosomal protein L4
MKLEVFNINGQSLGRQVELPSDVFGIELDKNTEHVVYLAVKQYLANQRQGTHKSKERNEVSGSTRKLHRQKGTGGSRKGSIKNPLYRGGGRIFGPRPRNYELKINKKVSRLARKAALTNKAVENRIIVVEDFKFDLPKTKNYLSFLSSFTTANGTLADKKSILMLNVPAAPTVPTAPKKPQGFRGRKQVLKAELLKNFQQAVDDYNTAFDSFENEYAVYQEGLKSIYGNIALSCRNIPNADVINAANFNVYQVLNADYIVLSESAISQINEVLNK